MPLKPDKLKPRTWVKYRTGMCQGCFSTCCTLPTPVNPEDLYQMGYLKLSQVNGPLTKIANQLLKKGIIHSFHAGTRLFILARHENGDCVFLDENRFCKIYERRPSVCRAFPRNSARPGYCPKIKVPGLKAKQAERLLKMVIKT